MSIQPIDIASIIGSLASAFVAYASLKFQNKKTDNIDSENSVTAPTVVHTDVTLITCFFIYVLCGLLTALLLWWSTLFGQSNWGSTHLIWVVGNSAIAFILYKKYLSKRIGN